MISQMPEDSATAAGDRSNRYDVAIIGGALSGAATATMLLRQNPALRVLIIERSPVFERRVGESTIEISTYFLNRVLSHRAWHRHHLNEHHYVKQGLRFWFQNKETHKFDDCSEIGSRFLTRVPAFMVDRAVLDEEVLKRAVALGAECRRPAQLTKIELVPGGEQKLTVRASDGAEEHILGALGRGCHRRPRAARPPGGLVPDERGSSDHCGLVALERGQKSRWPRVCREVPGLGFRMLRTAPHGHESPDGRRVVELVDPSQGRRHEHRAGLRSTPRAAARRPEHGRAAAVVRSSTGTPWRANCSRTRTGRRMMSITARICRITQRRLRGTGSRLSATRPGLSILSTARGWTGSRTRFRRRRDLILAERAGETDVPQRLDRHNRDYSRAYRRWFEAIYEDKYEYMGDFDLLRVAFLLDLGLYYIFVASQPFRKGADVLVRPIYSLPPSTPFFYLMRSYNRRLAAMARVRRARGVLGKNNARKRFLFGGFTFSVTSCWPILKAFATWARLELTEGVAQLVRFAPAVRCRPGGGRAGGEPGENRDAGCLDGARNRGARRKPCIRPCQRGTDEASKTSRFRQRLGSSVGRAED